MLTPYSRSLLTILIGTALALLCLTHEGTKTFASASASAVATKNLSGIESSSLLQHTSNNSINRDLGKGGGGGSRGGSGSRGSTGTAGDRGSTAAYYHGGRDFGDDHSSNKKSLSSRATMLLTFGIFAGMGCLVTICACCCGKSDEKETNPEFEGGPDNTGGDVSARSLSTKSDKSSDEDDEASWTKEDTQINPAVTKVDIAQAV
eukprot:CAMPEP_0178944610 /NCGR_PEP_ID=MMETSP0789-20121207/3251_1 /TAXON_ID=3005 /ORGANISM="Rhizosolenia setigera, Strain CCMP 1694" /LENGTH=204 /DNA_ID=CAMNT_0020624361 /DNA_START=116 /DNA_END=730 /DNA_ORIENTATION=-